MDILLEKNGWEITATPENAYFVMMLVASVQLPKAQLASWLKVLRFRAYRTERGEKLRGVLSTFPPERVAGWCIIFPVRG